ncbi:TPA: group II intron reverse transcriptase/maturase, partial [Bacillus cereus]|nr:group II intron reverse transcriptase/maturase [Bacillus cereus]
PDKSKVVNLKKNASDFLGFKIKVVQQGKAKFGYIAKTSMSDKAVTKTKRLLKEKIKDIQKVPTSESVNKFNIALIGVQNYYKYAVTIYMDLTVVKYTLWKTIRVRLRYKMKHIKFCNTSANFKKKARGIQPN